MPIEKKNVFGLTVGMRVFGNDRVKMVNVGATVTEGMTVVRRYFNRVRLLSPMRIVSVFRAGKDQEVVEWLCLWKVMLDLAQRK